MEHGDLGGSLPCSPLQPGPQVSRGPEVPVPQPSSSFPFALVEDEDVLLVLSSPARQLQAGSSSKAQAVCG